MIRLTIKPFKWKIIILHYYVVKHFSYEALIKRFDYLIVLNGALMFVSLIWKI